MALFISLILILISPGAQTAASASSTPCGATSYAAQLPGLFNITCLSRAAAARILLTPASREPYQWLIGAPGREWTVTELQLLHVARDDAIQVLAAAGLDGEALLSGYRFRRIFREYVDPDFRQIAVVNHQKEEIWLADAAFHRLDGFYIYHELGHVVDHRLQRRLSQAFFVASGGRHVSDAEGRGWRTAGPFWLRPHARDDPEEAAADAFALLAGFSDGAAKKPIFAGTPPGVDYAAIAAATSLALQESAGAGRSPTRQVTYWSTEAGRWPPIKRFWP